MLVFFVCLSLGVYILFCQGLVIARLSNCSMGCVLYCEWLYVTLRCTCKDMIMRIIRMFLFSCNVYPTAIAALLTNS